MMKKSYPRKLFELSMITVMHLVVLGIWFTSEFYNPSCIDCVAGWNISTLSNFQHIFVALGVIYLSSMVIYGVALHHRHTSILLFLACLNSSWIFALIKLTYRAS